MSSDITVAHIHGLLESFSKTVYRAKDSESGSLVSNDGRKDMVICRNGEKYVH